MKLNTKVLAKTVDVQMGTHTAKDASIVFDGDRNMLFVAHDEYEREVISTNLISYGYITMPGEVFIKDWSEHEGLTQSLVDAGLVEIIESVKVGPFQSTAHRVRIL